MEVYVTYFRSEDAFKAFKANRDAEKCSKEVISVLPIDTWRTATRSKNGDVLNELSSRIGDIDDDCEPSHFIFKMHLTPGMLLKIFRLFLETSSDFLSGLDLNYDGLDSPDDDDDENKAQNQSTKKSTSKLACESGCLEKREFEKRIAEIVVQYMGPKFEILTIQKDNVSAIMIELFAPVFKQLKTLTIHAVSGCSILYALPIYCPKLSSLHLDGDEWQGDFVQLDPILWPSLKDLYLNVYDLEDEETSDDKWKLCEEFREKLRKFIELNPQLETLQIDSAVDIDTLTTIGKNLKELHTLAFLRQNFEELNAVLDNLNGLKKLVGLKFSAYEVEKNDLNALSKCAKRLSRLRELQLITIFFNCKPGTEAEEDFVYLKEFSITHHFDCKCHGAKRTLSFDGYDVAVPNDSAVLVLIVNTKPPKMSADKTLEADILKAFKKTNKFYPNVIENLEQEERENYVYIQISSNRF